MGVFGRCAVLLILYKAVKVDEFLFDQVAFTLVVMVRSTRCDRNLGFS